MLICCNYSAPFTHVQRILSTTKDTKRTKWLADEPFKNASNSMFTPFVIFVFFVVRSYELLASHKGDHGPWTVSRRSDHQ